ncbi:MAG: ROK family protein [Spirochaetes bacterium]|nr:ROK family protein [Spirochaetota bacterium]MBN2770524.1 ROK family protein [Spirochaetota bacterium]
MHIGFDIGGTNIKAVITDNEGKVAASLKHPTGSNREEILNNIKLVVDALLDQTNSSLEELGPVGIGIPGSVDSEKGIILISPNIPSINDCNFASLVEEKIGKKTYILNDATAALLGEWWQGNGKNYSNWIMVTLGTGIGGGAIVDGRLLEGRDGFAAEFGHISIDLNGIPCSCGNRGCFERYASASSIAKLATEQISDYPDSKLNGETITAELLYSFAKEGDSFAKHMMSQCARYLAFGVNSLLNIFNPEAVIFAGGLSHASDLLFPLMQKELDKIGFKGIVENVHFHTVLHEDKGPSLGAIKFVIEKTADN